jgi:hypothetical protein
VHILTEINKQEAAAKLQDELAPPLFGTPSFANLHTSQHDPAHLATPHPHLHTNTHTHSDSWDAKKGMPTPTYDICLRYDAILVNALLLY